MDEGTAEDYQLTKVEEDAMIAAFPHSVLGWLKQMDVSSAYQLTRYEHSLQARRVQGLPLGLPTTRALGVVGTVDRVRGVESWVAPGQTSIRTRLPS